MTPTRERLQLRPTARKPEIIDLPAGVARPLDFGIKSISGNTVTIYGGTVIGHTGIVTVSDTAVTCGGTSDAKHLIVAQGAISPLSGLIVAVSVLGSTFSGHDATTWRRPLAEVYLANGAVVVHRIKWQGCIDLKAWVGA